MRIRVIVDDRGVSALGVGPILLNECNARQSHFQERPEVIFWQIAFKAPTLFAFGIHYQYGRSPDSVKAVKVSRILLDVHPERDEIFVDE